ncbi:MAG: HesA/MoeB/ThiF family protein [Methanothrix sp.]|nr:HesA/MoeB/ThiF family protein [Methanothrix sp.]MDD1733971.1 HesA/MoeB/ThiF family protein [Methanothrix sp.]OYV09542.1 MAG: adenylyltransferase and sulfurtransferase [Methanosaeta sp. NSP1]
MLSEEETRRYARQTLLFGEEGQEKLKRSSVFIAGAGGLGSAIAFYMAAAGFGRIRIVDCDAVDLSNLNRQILHAQVDLGRAKALSAYDALSGINPEIEVEAVVERISQDNIKELLQGCDLIMDGMDNFPMRYLLNRAALESGRPLFHGAISGYQGQATTIIPGRTACLSCLFPRAPPPATFPALGSTCGVIGSIEVTEAVKYVTGKGRLLENRLLLWDGLDSRLEEMAYEPNASCRECSDVSAKAVGFTQIGQR